MGKVELTSSDFWESDDVDVRLNPRLDLDTVGLSAFVSGLGLGCVVVFATSGSTGSGPKFVVLTKRAILASAEMVNRHLGVTSEDRWLCALTTFHVGGLGVWARAWRAGCFVRGVDGGRWDKSGDSFVKICRDHEITLTALTPTHLHDVVEGVHAAPESVRAVLIGGAALDSTLLARAIDLGWPILRTYGMTEAASQIATDPPELAGLKVRPDAIPILDGWDPRTNDECCLQLRGSALFSGYVVRDPAGEWKFDMPIGEDGFFETTDRVRLANRDRGEVMVTFEERADDRVKKLGELVSLASLRERLRAQAPKIEATILALSHDRLGHELVAVIGGAGEIDVARFNETVAPFERVDRVERVPALPRTELGKVAHGRLANLLRES